MNFPHLLERLNGLVIIFFGETVIDIAPYFHVAKFEIGALPVIVILFAMFTVYVMQFSYFVEINSVVYTFGFCLKTRLSSYPALSRMSIDTGNPLCS